MAVPPRPAKGRKSIGRGPGQQIIGGRDFRLADEVRYIQRQAANQHGRIVTVGLLIPFSTETGDAWLLDPADRLAARLARDGTQRTDPYRGNRYHVRHRLEGALSHQGTRLRLLRQQERPRDNDPRLPNRSARPDQLSRKFQISLVRIGLGKGTAAAPIGVRFQHRALGATVGGGAIAAPRTAPKRVTGWLAASTLTSPVPGSGKPSRCSVHQAIGPVPPGNFRTAKLWRGPRRFTHKQVERRLLRSSN